MNKIRTILVAEAVCLLLASSASAGSLKIPASVLIAAQASDLITTYNATHSGRGHESNPVMGGTGRQIALKAVSTSATLLLANKLQQHHPKVASGMVYVLAGSVGAIAIHNSRVGR